MPLLEKFPKAFLGNTEYRRVYKSGMKIVDKKFPESYFTRASEFVFDTRLGDGTNKITLFNVYNADELADVAATTANFNKTNPYVTDWGDGEQDHLLYHTYKEPGVYTVKAYYHVNNINNSNLTEGDLNKNAQVCLTRVNKIVDASFNTLNALFFGCKNLEYVDIENIKLNNVTSLRGIFNRCSKLKFKNIKMPTNFGSSVTSMRFAFYNCSSMTDIDISQWDATNVSEMNNMFTGCTSLKNLDLYTISLTNRSSISADNIFNGVPSSCNIYIDRQSTFPTAINNTTANYIYRHEYTVDTTLPYYTSYEVSEPSADNPIYVFGDTYGMIETVDFQLITQERSSIYDGNGNEVSIMLEDNSPSSLFNDSTDSRELYDLNDFGLGVINQHELRPVWINDNTVEILAIPGFRNIIFNAIVDWGDGTLDYKSTHTYATPGQYTIKTMEFINGRNGLDLRRKTAHRITDLVISNYPMSNYNNFCYEMYNLRNINLENINTLKLQQTSGMFFGCYNLESLDFSKFNGINLKESYAMFNGCAKLFNNITNNVVNIDLNTNNNENMNLMFANIPTPEDFILNITSFKFKSTAKYEDMFYNDKFYVMISDYDKSEVLKERSLCQFIRPNEYVLNVPVATAVTNNTEDEDVLVTSVNGDANYTLTLYNRNLQVENGIPTYTDWGDGTFDNLNSHTYITSGDYIVKSYKTCNSPQIGTSIWNNNLSITKINECLYTNMAFLFRGITNINSIDVSNINNKYNTSLYDVFSSCNQLTEIIGLENWDTSKVTNMTGLFYNIANEIITGIENWDTSNVSNMTGVFHNCYNLKLLDLSNWNTSNVSIMSSMFYNCSSLTSLNVSNFNTSKVTNMSSMFSGCLSLTSLDISNWNTSKVTNMSYMFNNCNKLTSLDLSNFNTRNVNNMQNMFYMCNTALKVYYTPPYWSLPTSGEEFNVNFIAPYNIYTIDSSLLESNAIQLYQNTSKKPFTIWGDGSENNELTHTYDTTNGTEFTIYTNLFHTEKQPAIQYTFVNTTNAIEEESLPSLGSLDVITDHLPVITCDNDLGIEYRFILNDGTFTNDMTTLVTNVKTVEIRYLNDEYFDTISHISFKDLNKIKSIDKLILPTSLTDFSDMFNRCISLTSINGIEYWNVSSVTDMTRMFYDCLSLEELNLKRWQLNENVVVTDMFTGCQSNCIVNYTPEFWLAPISDKVDFEPSYNIYTIDLSSLDESNPVIELYNNMIDEEPFTLWGDETYNSSLTHTYNTANATEYTIKTNLFPERSRADIIYRIVNNLTNIDPISNSLPNITILNDINNIEYNFILKDGSETSKQTTPIKDVSIVEIRYNGTEISNISFKGKTNIRYIDRLKFPNTITSMEEMFSSCSSLESVNAYGWDTSNVTTMDNAFSKCINLKSLDASTWDINSLTNVSNMFNGCGLLHSLDLSTWNTTNITSYTNMLTGTDLYADGWNYNETNYSNFKLTESDINYNDYFPWNCFVLEYTIHSYSDLHELDILYENTDTPGVQPSLAESEEVSDQVNVFTRNVYLPYFITGFDEENLKMTYMYSTKKNTIAYLKDDTTSSLLNYTYTNDVEKIRIYYPKNTLAVYFIGDNYKLLHGVTEIKRINTSNFISMANMFNSTNLKYLDASNWDTSKVSSTYSMFENCIYLERLDLSNWNTSNLIQMGRMFYNCVQLITVNLSDFNTDSLKDMSETFYGCESLIKLDLSNFFKNNCIVEDMESLFSGCENLIDLKLPIMKFTKLQYMGWMFAGCYKLESLDLTNFDFSNNDTKVNCQHMFSTCYNLTSLNLSNWDKDKINLYSIFDDMMKILDWHYDGTNYTNFLISEYDSRYDYILPWNLVSMEFTVIPREGYEETDTLDEMYNYYNPYYLPVYSYTNDSSPSAYFSEDSIYIHKLDGTITNDTENTLVKDIDYIKIEYSKCLKRIVFNGKKLLTGHQLSTVRDMYIGENCTSLLDMFCDCRQLTSVNTDNWHTNNITTMENMFYNCYKLEEVNLNNLNTDNLNTLKNTFYFCKSLESLDLSNWNTTNVTNMYGLFTRCDSLKLLDLSNWNTNAVLNDNETNMFYNISTNIDWHYDGTNYTNFTFGEIETSYDGIFPWNLIYMEYSLDTNETDDNTDIFAYSTANASTGLIAYSYIPNFKYSSNPEKYTSRIGVEFTLYLKDGSVTNDTTNTMTKDVNKIRIGYSKKFIGMKFTNWDTNATTKLKELLYLDTSNFTTFDCMFENCRRLTSINTSNWVTSNVTNMNGMFTNCELLTSLDLSNFDTSQVNNMTAVFKGCSSLTSLNLSTWNTTKVIQMNNIFNNCSSLTSIDLSNFDTSSVKYMNDMFNGCSSLTSLNLSNFNTSNVIYMQNMFNNCTKLKALNISSFNTSKLINIFRMFQNCSSLISLDLSHFNTSLVEGLDYTFDGCSNLESLNLSNWDTSKVTFIYGTFRNCSSLTSLDLSTWNTSKVTDLRNAFEGCSSLTSLNLSTWNTKAVIEKENMLLSVPDNINWNYNSSDETSYANFNLTEEETNYSGTFPWSTTITQE